MKKTAIIIPSRLESTRFPNKPLAKIKGIPMIVHVMNRAKESNVGKEILSEHLIDIGRIPAKELLDIYETKDVVEIIGRIESYYKLNEALEQYKTENSLM